MTKYPTLLYKSIINSIRMDYKQIPIYMDRTKSQTIAREKMIKVFNEISLQFYHPDKSKVKLSNMFMEVRTHRIILEDKNNPDRYFEIHYDKIRVDIQPVNRGVFNKYTYKIQIIYFDNFMFELKNGTRGDFLPEYSLLRKIVEDSRSIVD